MHSSQIVNCSFERWYPLFKHFTFKSDIIPIPDEVLHFLRNDSTVVLPKSCQEELDLVQKKEREERKKEFETDSEDEEFWKDANINDKEFPDFPEFDAKIRESLSRLGNRVFVKLNWSSPRDAFWSVNKSYAESLSDVYILLRSSDFVSHDLNHPFDGCDDTPNANSNDLKYFLILRRWLHLNPMMEFRCFVRDNNLVGVSQRDCRSFYQHLIDNKDAILERIRAFYSDAIQGKFADKSFTFDVYVDENKVRLVDFNPFGSRTDSLLYSWDELMGNDESKPSSVELRLVDVETGVQHNEMSMYGCPIELLAASGLDSEALTSLVQKNVNLQSKDTDESDDNE